MKTLTRSQMHAYQVTSVDKIKSTPKCALFQQCGLGKTVSALTAIADINPQRVLIVAPLRVAKTVWHNEAQKWEHLQHLTFSICVGTPAQRVIALQSDAQIHVINIDCLSWLVKDSAIKPKYDMVIFDEFSLLKSHSSQRFKASKALCKNMERVVGLTGSPAANSVHDLWSQLFLLDGGARLFKTVSAFRSQWFDVGYNQYTFKPKPSAMSEITAKIDDICLSMKAADYLDMPPVVHNEVMVDMSPAAHATYKEIRKELIVEVGKETIAVANAAVLVGKCIQIANGFLYDENKNALHLHDAKIDALESIISETNAPILLFYTFKADLEKIKSRFDYVQTLQDNSEQKVKDWNAGKIPLLACHPASAGHGLNLQQGGNVVVWYGLTHSLGLFEQANARIHRQGQTKTVFIHYILADKTIDSAVLAALKNKEKVQDAVFNSLK
jgi:SNF2 family DNA or RNA helicase